MAVLTIWVFSDADAATAVDTVTTLQRSGWVDIFDAALLRWPQRAQRPTITQVLALRRPTSLDQTFWTRLLGLTFFPASFGVGLNVVGTTLTGELADVGLTPELTGELRDTVGPGSGALFVYSSGALLAGSDHDEQVRALLAGLPTTLLRSNLTGVQADKLQHIFAAGQTPG